MQLDIDRIYEVIEHNIIYNYQFLDNILLIVHNFICIYYLYNYYFFIYFFFFIVIIY